MAKASAHITLTYVIDIVATYRYYLLQSSTLAKPSVPTTNPPSSAWNDVEPSYTSGSTNSLYYVDLTVFSDNSFSYTPVSLSTSYEAAKEAYNKAANAQNTANSAKEDIDNLEIGGRNYIPESSLESASVNWTSGNGNADFTEGYLNFTKQTTGKELYCRNVENPLAIVSGETYTLSAEVMKLADYDIPADSSVSFGRYFEGGSSEQISMPIPTTLEEGQWTKIAHTETWRKGSKNLLVLADQTGTFNNGLCTYEIKGGVVTISGDPLETSTLIVTITQTATQIWLPPGKYTLYLDGRAADCRYRIKSTGATTYFWVNGIKTLDIAEEFCIQYIQLYYNTSHNNYTIRPMLLSGEYTVDTLPEFEPYIASLEAKYAQAAVALGSSAGGIACRRLKFEKGNQATDWTPAPEDVEEQINDGDADVQVSVTEQLTQLVQDTEGIIMKKLESCVKDSDLGSIKESISAELQVKADQISAIITQINDDKTATGQRLEALENFFQKHFIVDENGITIRSTDSSSTLQLDNDKGIVFSKDSAIQSKMWGDNFYTGNIFVEVTKQARFGGLAAVPRSERKLTWMEVGN